MKIDLSTIIQQRDKEQKGQVPYKISGSNSGNKKSAEKKKSVDIKPSSISISKPVPTTTVNDPNKLKV